MRLPQGKRTGVQSLGRGDINAPSREWAAKTNARNAMVGAIQSTLKVIGDVYEKQDDNANQLKYRQHVQQDKAAMEEARVFMANTSVVDVENFKGPDGILKFLEANPGKYRDEPGGTTAKTHGFMLDYAKFQAEELNKGAMESLQGTKYQSNYVADMTSTVVGSIQGLGTSKAKQAQAANSAKAGILYQDAVDGLDENSAMEMIESNVGNGTWTPEFAAEKQMTLGRDIDHGSALARLSSNSAGELGVLASEVFTEPNRMSNTQRMSIYDKAESKRARIEGAQQQAREKWKNERSGKARTGLMRQLYTDQQPMTVDDIANAGLSDADERAMYALNDQFRAKAAKAPTSPRFMANVQMEMAELSVPSQESIARRKMDLKNRLAEGLMSGELSPDDAPKLFNQVESMSKVPYATPQYKQARDMIFVALVGGVETNEWNMGQATQVSKLNAYNMVNGLHAAYQEEGAEFEPTEWVQANVKQFETEAMQETSRTLDEQLGQGYIIRGSDGYPDSAATREKMKRDYKNGKIPKDKVKLLEDMLRQEEKARGEMGR